MVQHSIVCLPDQKKSKQERRFVSSSINASVAFESTSKCAFCCIVKYACALIYQAEDTARKPDFGLNCQNQSNMSAVKVAKVDYELCGQHAVEK